MNRNKGRDDKFFNCSEEHEFKYVSGRFEESDLVYAFLKEKCKVGEIKYSSHKEVYELIKDELGFFVFKK